VIFSERSLGTNLVQFTSVNVLCVSSYYPKCNLLFKTSYTYNKMPISHFCGDQLKQHKIRKLSNLRNIVLMGIWLGSYKKYVNLQKTQNAGTWNWDFTVFVNCCPIWRVTSDNLWPNLCHHLSEICLVCALYKNMLLRQKPHDCRQVHIIMRNLGCAMWKQASQWAQHITHTI